MPAVEVNITGVYCYVMTAYNIKVQQCVLRNATSARGQSTPATA